MSDEDAARITYLIGELHRRVGEKDVAEKWFERVAPLVANNEELEWLTEAAHRQRTDPKDFFG